MSRILITGSADGLGRAAAGALMDDGHDVVIHARSRERAASVAGLATRAAGVVIGDLSSAAGPSATGTPGRHTARASSMSPRSR